ncbi:MAG: hypothetical protein MUO43_09940 [Desulfobacterales bacterium]|nr:hypothetical protein [Desulfobacterales bacterium]
MAKKMAEEGFLKRLFGKKSNCCSFQIEEIRNETAGGVTRDQKTSDNKCCSTPNLDEDNTSDGNDHI